MRRGMGILVMIALCIGASALFAEARTHTEFSGSSYYESNETVKNESSAEPKMRYPRGHYPGQLHIWNPQTEKYETADADPSDSDSSTNKTTSGPNGRYPHGHYPGQKHVWNPETEKYETVNATEPDADNSNSTSNVTDPSSRYPHGHYPGQKHVWNPETEKYETVNETKSSTNVTSGDPNSRYPLGHYPGQTHVWNPKTEKYDTVSTENVTTQEHRYDHGYYGKAKYNYSDGDMLEVIKSEGNYTESKSTTPAESTQDRYPAGYNNGHSTKPASTYQQYSSEDDDEDKTTFDSDEGRYKYGYYPKSAKTTTSLASEDTTDKVGATRYPLGYFPNSQYTQQVASASKKSVTYSSTTGDSSTLPYSKSGVPFVPNGAGCRTAYWADHPTSWPSFLSVKSTVGEAFGEKATEVYGQTTILNALLKYNSDPYSELLRAGCTALLNSYSRGEFKISHMNVIEEFTAALISKEVAAKQAVVFETANVESISAGEACT